MAQKNFRIKKGLDLPISGSVDQSVIHDGPAIRKVALLGPDYVGLKPTMLVKVGDTVKLGQPVFTDKKQGTNYCAPAAGKIVEVNRGDKRVFESLVIEISGDEQLTFKSHKPNELGGLSRDEIIKQLVESGAWSSIRSRPYSKTALPDRKPTALFITAIDTNPLAADVTKVLEGHEEAFEAGLTVLSKLTEGKTYLCTTPAANLASDNAETISFAGPHPAGNVGTHIHLLEPVSEAKEVWHVGYQDVVAVGYLFTTGKIYTERVIALAGPAVKQPRLVRTRLGASIDQLTAQQLADGEVRPVSGSLLSGHTAVGPFAYLGRYHNQVSVIAEDRKRELLGWHKPGLNQFSVQRIYVSKLLPKRRFAFTTTTNGSPRAMVPIGSYEKVMPLDILPTHLLRALLVNDTTEAVELGALELDEEDLALCTFVSPGKFEFGPVLRKNLELIEKGE